MSLKIFRSSAANRNFKLSAIFNLKYYSSSVVKKDKNEDVDIASAELEPIFEPEKYDEIEMLKIRDKSRLNPSHRNKLFGKIPYTESVHWSHNTLKYKRKLIGTYGIKAVDINPGIAWPSQEEVEISKEYERVAYPVTIQEGWKLIAEKHEQEAAAIRRREAEIEENMKKVQKWKSDLQAKIAKKEKDILEAKARRDHLIEEVRQHFGFKIDSKDERFKQMLEQKEKEDKKRKKEAKKKEKQTKYLAKIEELQKSMESLENINESTSDKNTSASEK